MTPTYTQTAANYSGLSEGAVEDVALDYFRALGYKVVHGLSPDAPDADRISYSDVLLLGRLRAALARLNAQLPPDAIDDVVRQIVASTFPTIIEENRRLHKLLVDGVPVQYMQPDGTIKNDIANLIDWDNRQNDWLAVNQFTIIEDMHTRRPDIILFLNGLPVSVLELKKPGDENATLDGAFRQLQVYKQQIGSLFRTNALLVVSDGLWARVGSLTSDFERFMPWRTVDGTTIAPKGTPELKTLIQGIFEQSRFLELLRHFTVFQNNGSELRKVIAGYHQFHAVRHAVECTIKAIATRLIFRMLPCNWFCNRLRCWRLYGFDPCYIKILIVEKTFTSALGALTIFFSNKRPLRMERK